MCAEPRDGKLYLFMPPTQHAGGLSRTRRRRRGHGGGNRIMPVISKATSRLRSAPDAFPRHARSGRDRGQHPSGGELGRAGRRTTHLYEAAHQSRLTTEKFMLDGRHTGTGGGNHFVLGGATPNDSPFLRRPDLLRSLISYWHNHPVAVVPVLRPVHRPDQQAPRVDEARNDSLYELEIAFRSSRAGIGCPPWLVDRLLRNLLIDVTGNTHRAEFCIDKLYSPDGPTGRLGLLELRAFEMPPHARMSLAQQLLLRRLLARFWAALRPARLARWGTELHDRFMLPHFVEQDFADVMRRCARPVYPSAETGLRRISSSASPSTATSRTRASNSNCARAGALACDGRGRRTRRHGALRRFLGGALQVKVTGWRRTAMCCLQRRSVPLQPTGTVGEFVGGVRYRAWQPAVLPASDHRRARAAGVRPGGHLDAALAGRLPVPRGPSGRPQLRHLPGQCLRGREPAPGALLPLRPYARWPADGRCGRIGDSSPPSECDAGARAETRRRLEFVDRRIQENGVTYNVYADANGAIDRGRWTRCR
jgi:hypothetical protein